MSYFVIWLKYDFLDHAYILLVGRHVYSVAKFRGGFSENNLANFAKLTRTIKLRLCANTVLCIRAFVLFMYYMVDLEA